MSPADPPAQPARLDSETSLLKVWIQGMIGGGFRSWVEQGPSGYLSGSTCEGPMKLHITILFRSIFPL
jgi:hypothetical protein